MEEFKLKNKPSEEKGEIVQEVIEGLLKLYQAEEADNALVIVI